MLELFHAYKHRNNSDVAIYVAMVVNDNPDADYVRYLVHWTNVVNPRHHFITASEEIEIKRSDLINWQSFEVNFHE